MRGASRRANWDPVSQKKMRDALLILSASLPDLKKAFGSRVQVDQVRHLIGTAAAWGGSGTGCHLSQHHSKQNDGATVYKLSVPGKVPVNAFWSVTVYDAQGYLKKNQYDVFSERYRKKGTDGSVAIRGGRLRRENPELPADHVGLELYGAPLSAAR